MSYSLFNVKYIISNFIIVVLYILISSTLLYFASNHKYYHNDFSIVVLIVFFIVIVSSIITTTRRLENYKIDTIKNIDLLLKINEQVIKDIMYKDKSFSTVFFFIFSLSTAVIAYIIETSSEVNFNDFTTVTNVLSHNLFIIVIYNLLFIIYLLFKYFTINNFIIILIIFIHFKIIIQILLDFL